MKLVVKILQGEECTVEISPTDTVCILKNRVKELLGVEVSQQKLIFLGKALSDENPLSFYPGIKDGCRLYLVVKKDLCNSIQSSSEAKTPTPKSGIAILKEEMTRILKQYYTPTETDAILNELIKELRKKVDSLTYDDLERLATALIQDQETST
ncbi:ubiquitin-like protein 4A [Venturia canescens]|uniref:ubiquitin-like protein 4A n=1 Tax=Venturia canescens TaxID=32260 RepID=UPI001C9C0E3C|nr:ubiquitin-like protein 4A [Venturia canescens]